MTPQATLARRPPRKPVTRSGLTAMSRKKEIMLEHVPDPADHKRAIKEIMEHEDWLELDRGRLDLEPAIDRFTKRTGFPRDAVSKIMAAMESPFIEL